MCWTVFAYMRDEKWLKNVGEVKGKDQLKDLGLDRRTIMK